MKAYLDNVSWAV